MFWYLISFLLFKCVSVIGYRSNARLVWLDCNLVLIVHLNLFSFWMWVRSWYKICVRAFIVSESWLSGSDGWWLTGALSSTLVGLGTLVTMVCFIKFNWRGFIDSKFCSSLLETRAHSGYVCCMHDDGCLRYWKYVGRNFV